MNEDYPLYDLSTFKEMELEEPGALSSIVSVFIQSTPDILQDLNQAYKDKNFQVMASLAHKLKATIDILSIKSLFDVIRRIEHIGKTLEDQTELPALFEKLNTTFTLVFDKISKEIG